MGSGDTSSDVEMTGLHLIGLPFGGLVSTWDETGDHHVWAYEGDELGDVLGWQRTYGISGPEADYWTDGAYIGGTTRWGELMILKPAEPQVQLDGGRMWSGSTVAISPGAMPRRDPEDARRVLNSAIFHTAMTGEPLSVATPWWEGRPYAGPLTVVPGRPGHDHVVLTLPDGEGAEVNLHNDGLSQLVAHILVNVMRWEVPPWEVVLAHHAPREDRDGATGAESEIGW